MSGHVLFIVENNSVPFDRRVWNEARAAKEFGYEVSVICPVSRRARERFACLEGIRIYRHPCPREGSGKWAVLIEYANAYIWEWMLSLRVFLTHPFQIIHGANPPDHLFLIALPFKLLGVKFVFDHHDLTPETYVAKYGARKLIHQLLLWMERLTFRTADIVISTNESYRKVALERGGKTEADVVVVRNGPDLRTLPAVSPDPHLREGFRYLVGYVGIIGQQEGIENLLKAVDYLVKERQRTDITFAVVGSGPHLEAVIRFSREMGLEPYVRFFGYVPDRTLYEILKTADVCVNPEFGNEFTDKSTMIKVMEYMSFGKPIVQFFTTEGQVTAGESAVYIKANDVRSFAEAVLDLLEDPSRRASMGRIGKERIETLWSWVIQMRGLRTAYQRVLFRDSARVSGAASVP